MTIRETTTIQKKFYPFILFKLKHRITFLSMCLLFVFSNSLSAQEDTTIASDNFEDTKPAVSVTTKQPEQVTSDEQKVIEETDDALNDQKTDVTVVQEAEITTKELTPVVENTIADEQIAVIEENNDVNELQKAFDKQQVQLEQLTQNLSELTQQNKALDSKLSLLQKAFDDQAKMKSVKMPELTQNKHPKLKVQVINLAIQTSLLRPETAKPEDKTEESSKESAWYEKLVVVKKIDAKQTSAQEKTPLYAVLKQYDLLQLALEDNNQNQWQKTLQTITTTLQNQYPQQAQSIIEELKTLQSQNIAVSEQSENTAVDDKFGIK
jgi:HAMP domain-containing protein